MRNIIAGFATSIDGYIEGPNGEYDWITQDKEQYDELKKFWENIDTMFYGRKTYEAAMAMQKGKKKQANPFSHMKHYIFSTTLKSVGEDYILVSGDIKKEVEKIKNVPGKNIAVFGGANLLSSLMGFGLVDELSYGICPVVLGKGKPMLTSIDHRIHFELKECRSYPSGLVSLSYIKK
jgi:dihydrofolate reductase